MTKRENLTVRIKPKVKARFLELVHEKGLSTCFVLETLLQGWITAAETVPAGQSPSIIQKIDYWPGIRARRVLQTAKLEKTGFVLGQDYIDCPDDRRIFTFNLDVKERWRECPRPKRLWWPFCEKICIFHKPRRLGVHQSNISLFPPSPDEPPTKE